MQEASNLPPLAQLIQSLPFPVALLDAELNYIACSEKWYQFHNIQEKVALKALPGADYFTSFPEVTNKFPAFVESHQATLERTEPVHFVDVVRTREDDYQYVNWSIYQWLTNENHIGGLIVTSEDATDKNDWRRLQDLIADVYFTTDTNGQLKHSCDKLKKLLQCNDAELRQKTIFDLIHSQDQAAIKRHLDLLFGGQKMKDLEVRLQVNDSEYRWLQMSGRFDHDNGLAYLLARDVTEAKSQQSLMAAMHQVQDDYIHGRPVNEIFEDLLRSILDLTQSEYGFIGSIERDTEKVPFLKTYAMTNIAWNEETRQFYAENAPRGLIFKNLNSLFGHTIKTGELVISNDPENDPRAGGIPEGHPPLNAYIGIPIESAHGMVAMIGIANRKKGYDQAMHDFLEPLLNTVGSIVDAQLTYHDLEKKNEQLSQLNTRLEKLALYDYLTELPNRVYFDKELDHVLKRSKRFDRQFALLYIDLDYFKQVNDNLGHHVGDDLLKEVANRFNIVLRDYDIIARMGGDEFALIIRDFDEKTSVEIVAKKIIKMLLEPFHLHNEAIYIGCSVGIAIYPEHGLDAVELKMNADKAMYSAKESGRHCYQYPPNKKS